MSTIKIKRNTTLTTIKQLNLQTNLNLYTFLSFRFCLTAFRNLTLVAKLPKLMFLLCFFYFRFLFLIHAFLFLCPFSLVLLSKPQIISLVLISLDRFWIFNYTLFSSDCFTMKQRWNHDETIAALVVCWVPIVLAAFWLVERGNRKEIGNILERGSGHRRKQSERARVPSERGRNYVNEGWCHEARRRDRMRKAEHRCSNEKRCE